MSGFFHFCQNFINFYRRTKWQLRNLNIYIQLLQSIRLLVKIIRILKKLGWFEKIKTCYIKIFWYSSLMTGLKYYIEKHKKSYFCDNTRLRNERRGQFYQNILFPYHSFTTKIPGNIPLTKKQNIDVKWRSIDFLILSYVKYNLNKLNIKFLLKKCLALMLTN